MSPLEVGLTVGLAALPGLVWLIRLEGKINMNTQAIQERKDAHKALAQEVANHKAENERDQAETRHEIVDRLVRIENILFRLNSDDRPTPRA